MPTEYKKSETKEGDEFRRYVFFFMILHLLNFGISIAFITFWVAIKQILYVYLAYCIMMTLNSCVTVIYAVFMSFGIIYDISDFFTVKTDFAGKLLYLLICLMNGFAVWFVSRKMIKYTRSKDQIKSEPLIKEDDNEATPAKQEKTSLNKRESKVEETTKGEETETPKE